MSTHEPTPQEGTATELTDHTTVVAAPARWEGPFAERDKYGELTGAHYVRCSSCGVEVLTGGREHATHRDGCDGPEK